MCKENTTLKLQDSFLYGKNSFYISDQIYKKMDSIPVCIAMIPLNSKNIIITTGLSRAHNLIIMEQMIHPTLFYEALKCPCNVHI